MIGVVDTSALIRLYIPDGPIPDGVEEFFRGVERGRHKAIAPELLIAEVANVIRKKQRAGEITDYECNQLLSEILSLPIRLFPHSPIVARAFQLAGKSNLTVYDTLYLSLAEEHGAVLFSADDKMIKTAVAMQLAPG